MYNAKPLSSDDAMTWNYFRPYIVDNYNRLVAGVFNATVPGTSEEAPAACFTVEFCPRRSVGFCTFKYLLGQVAVGDPSVTMNSMSSHCSIFLHSIIIRKKIEENINRARDLSTYGFDEYSSYLQRNLEASNRKIGTVQFVTSVNLFNLPFIHLHTICTFSETYLYDNTLLMLTISSVLR